MSVKTSLGKFGNRFAFEFFLETMYVSIIQELKKYLSDTKAEDIPAMIRKGEFPSSKHLDFSAVGDNIEHVKKISLLRLMEFFAEARPDVAQAIQDRGNAGAEYMVKLRIHLLDKIRQSAGDKGFRSQEDTVMAHCDKCDRRWPVKKEEFSSIEVCPFCGTGKSEEAEPSSEDK